MRVLAMLAVSAAALPLVAFADPAPVATPSATQTAPAAAAPAPTMATQTPTAPSAAATASADNGVNLDEVECRSTPPATGTRLGGGRECHTVREWNERMRQDQRMLEQRQSVPMMGKGGGG